MLFLIADFAFEVTTFFNQSSDGFWLDEVITLTWSPLFSWWLIGTSLSSIFAPVHFEPNSEWIENAKSITVEFCGKVFKSPFGVKTKFPRCRDYPWNHLKIPGVNSFSD